jgi:hypothetical protein
MMKAQDLKNIEKKGIGQNEYRLAEDIYCKLNQGSLYEIYKIMDRIKSVQVRESIGQAFVEKYHFDFHKYI